MGYERNDRRGFGDDRYGRGRSDWRSGGHDRGFDRDRGGPPSGYSYDDRGFFDRAGDEVRSWFGDEEAERRRRYDERYDDRYEAQADRGRHYGRDDWDRDQYARSQGYDRGAGRYAGGDYGRGRYGSPSQGYGRDRPGSDHDRFATRAGGTASDHSYGSWRDRQLQTFDSDYDDYRRENQSRFDTEFATYRNRRQGQRDQLGKVQEHMEVVGSDGQHVGTVDHVRGDRIRLTRNDQAAGGHHHSIPSSWIDSVDDKVTIAKTADEAKRAWREAADDNGDRGNGGGLFGRRDESDRTDWSTDRNLNRSFSGTY